MFILLVTNERTDKSAYEMLSLCTSTGKTVRTISVLFAPEYSPYLKVKISQVSMPRKTQATNIVNKYRDTRIHKVFSVGNTVECILHQRINSFQEQVGPCGLTNLHAQARTAEAAAIESRCSIQRNIPH